MSEKLERIYLSITGDSCSIYHRPTHQYMYSCSTKEAVKEVKRLLKMTIKEFYKYLVNDVRYFKLIQPKTHGDLNTHGYDDKEKWYQEAWKCGTDRLLKDNKIKMIYEDIPWDYIEGIQNNKQSGWSLGIKKTFNNDEELKQLNKEEDKPKVRRILKRRDRVKTEEPPVTKEVVKKDRQVKRVRRIKRAK